MSCWDWCETCSNNIFGICSLIEWNDINIIEETQLWDCCKSFSIASLVDIDSPDGSISVTKTWSTFHITTSDTDEDELAGVNSSDTPWYLANKLVSTCNDILAITPVQIWDSSWVLNFCIDPSKIVTPDEKVAAAAWCSPWYLGDLLTTNIPDTFSFIKVWCGVQLQITEHDRFLAHIRTHDHYLSWNFPLGAWWYWLIEQWYWSSESTMPSNVLDLTFAGTISWWWTNSKVIILPRDWRYGIWFWWSCKTSQSIQTIRNQVVVFRWWVEVLRVFDDRFSAPLYQDTNSDGALSWNDFLNPMWYIYQTDIPSWTNWVDWTLANSVSCIWFGGYRLMQLEAGDIITFVYKVDTGWDNNQFLTWPKIWYTAQWLDIMTQGKWSGVWVSVQEELTKRINN